MKRVSFSFFILLAFCLFFPTTRLYTSNTQQANQNLEGKSGSRNTISFPTLKINDDAESKFKLTHAKPLNIINQSIKIGPIDMLIHSLKTIHFHPISNNVSLNFIKVDIELINNAEEPLIMVPIKQIIMNNHDVINTNHNMVMVDGWKSSRTSLLINLHQNKISDFDHLTIISGDVLNMNKRILNKGLPIILY